MIVKVGSKNPVKIEAVTETLLDYPIFTGCQVIGVDVSSGISDQPKDDEETYQGALNRAFAALKSGADIGIGIESGMTQTALGCGNFTAAVIIEKQFIEKDLYNLSEVGETYESFTGLSCYEIADGCHDMAIHFGQSTVFPLPGKVANLMLNGKEMDDAVFELGLVDVPNIGEHEGFLSYLTKGRVSRKDYTKQALRMALISLENKSLYECTAEQNSKQAW